MVCMLAGCGPSQVKTTHVSVHEAIEEPGVDAIGRLLHSVISTYDPRGNKTESQKFDASGVLTEMYRYTYDNFDHLVERISYDPSGTQIQEDIYHYDKNGNLIENDRYNLLLKQYNTFHHEYDKTGRKIEVVRRDSDGAAQAIRTFTYDNLGTKSQTFEDMEYGYRSVTKYLYDEYGNEIESYEYEADGSIKLRYVTEYDENENIISRVICSSNGSVIRSFRYEYRYDRKGNWSRKTEYQNARPALVSVREIEYY